VTHTVSRDELPHSETAYKFEGYRHGDVNVSFFLSETPPERGPGLHTHPYEEVFVVQEGELTFTVGEAAIEATGGQILVVRGRRAAQVRQLRPRTGPTYRHPHQPAHDHRMARGLGDRAHVPPEGAKQSREALDPRYRHRG
jgi:mannose-6-phosphate isomerase-like protein (cupin superfamily)